MRLNLNGGFNSRIFILVKLYAGFYFKKMFFQGDSKPLESIETVSVSTGKSPPPSRCQMFIYASKIVCIMDTTILHNNPLDTIKFLDKCFFSYVRQYSSRPFSYKFFPWLSIATTKGSFSTINSRTASVPSSSKAMTLEDITHLAISAAMPPVAAK